VEVEAVHSETLISKFPANKTRLRQLELEEAVMRQELMAGRYDEYANCLNCFILLIDEDYLN
jgi:hypothetical protein